MTKLDKTKPNIIPIHAKNPELAKEIVKNMQQAKELDKKEGRLKHLQGLNDAQRKVLWDKIEEKYEDDIQVISPEGHLTWDIDGEEVFIKKCDHKKKHEGMPDMLKRMIEKVTGGEVVMGEFPMGLGKDKRH